MSLQVWLPLNGDLTNYGLSQITTSGTPGWLALGKISNKSLNLANQITVNLPESMKNTSIWSMCFWGIVQADSTITYDWCKIMQINETGANGNGTFRWETCYSSSLASRGISWHNNTSYNITTAGSVMSPGGKDKWVHCCFVSDGTKCYTYFNGVQDTAVYDSGHGTLRGQVYIGQDAAHIKGAIQDVRFYDHALSPKEVKEVSKALVLHYKLDNCGGMFEPTRNLISAAQSCKDPTQISIGTYVGSLSPSTAAVGNSVITYSAYIKNTSSVNINIRCSPLKVDGGYSTFTGNVIKSGQEGWSSVTVDISDATIYTGSIYLYFQNGTAGSVPASDKIVVQFVQVEAKDHRTAWTLGGTSRTNNVEIDCGIANVYDGTIDAAATYTSNTPRYSSAIQSNGTATLITSTQNFSFLDNSPFSISIWAYSDDWETSATAKNRYIIHKYDGTGGGFQIYSIKDTHRFRIYWADSSGTAQAIYFQTADTFIGAGWHHFVAIFDGSTMSTYLDGKYYTKKSSTSFKNTSSALNFKVGNGSNTLAGAFSDCRIYATALSAEDVLELYHTAAWVDNGNNAMAYEFKEA